MKWHVARATNDFLAPAAMRGCAVKLLRKHSTRGETLNRPRILITRTRHQASELAAAVERLGAEAILVPMIEVVPPRTFEELDEAIVLLGETSNMIDLVVFTSANAVQALARRASELGARLSLKRIAAIGPATAKAVEAAGMVPVYAPVLVPREYVAESLAAALLEASEPAQQVLLIRAEEARDVVPAQLEAAGHRVRIAAAYRNVTPAETLHGLRTIFATRETYPEVITFTSSSTARNLVALLTSIERGIPTGIALASIGPITSATLRELGYEPSFEAKQPTIESLVEAIASHLGRI